MLRPKKFRPFESAILRGVAMVLLGASAVRVVVAVQRGHWQLACASVAVLILSVLYYYAARRGGPL